MKLIISHFFNEEFLLPWWLEHHREKFDHGVLINYHSTDRSVEICRELAPDWEIVTSANEYFSALRCDFEVMQHEARFPEAWKIVLNTTEFLVGSHLDDAITCAEAQNDLGISIPGAAMVDNQPEIPPDPARPLVEQKFNGFWESEFPMDRVQFPWFFARARTRLLHRYAFGAYTPGRHSSMLPRLTAVPNTELGIWWYGYSPWTDDFVARKTQIQTKMDPLDKKVGMGVQHVATEQEQQMRHAALLNFSHHLSMSPRSSVDRDRSWAQLIDARNNAVVDRDVAMAELNAAISERDAATAERDVAIAERDEAIRACRNEARARRHAQKHPWKYFGTAWRMRSPKNK